MIKKMDLDISKIFLPLIVLFSILRIYIGNNVGLWYFISSVDDDLLMLNYSNLFYHFTNWNILSLTKDMSYSLFLFVVNISNIPYSFYLSILWIIAGLLTIYAIYKFVNKNKLLLLISFLFIIFLPIAFDSSCGTRIYRNAIMAQVIIIFLSVLFIFISNAVNNIKDNKKLFIWALILGIIFSFNYYIKEDGILTLPIFLICIFAIIFYHCYKFKSKINFKYLFILFIPILIFGASTFMYKEINSYYFGIDEINTRTGGEIGEFWNILLKIDDNNKNTIVWVPPSTIEKAWAASPTLQSKPELLDNWLRSDWAKGNMTKNQLSGDYVAWSLRDSLSNVGMFNNEKQANDFFKQVNDELYIAFDNGKLNKSDKIFITSSANGKTLDEIIKLEPYMTSGIKSCIFYKDLIIGENPLPESSQVVSNDNTRNTEKILNEKLITQNDMNNPGFSEYISLKFMKLDLKIYQVVSYLIVLLASISFIYSIIYQIKNKFNNLEFNVIVGFEFLLITTFIVEIFAIGWFCSWIDISLNPMKFYTVANQGIFALFEVISILGAIKIYTFNNLKS